MNLKELFFIAVMALGLMWGVDYIIGRFIKKPQQAEEVAQQAGQSYTAPKTKQELKPQNSEVEFSTEARPAQAKTVAVDTPSMRAVFSTDGASLEKLEFKRGGRLEHTLSTIAPLDDCARERRCFLVALEGQTPFYYELQSSQENAENTQIIFVSSTAQGTIRKTFVVWKNKYQIDLNLTLVPQDGQAMVARVFFPTPAMADASRDPKSLIVSGVGGKITKIARSSLDERKGWYEPTLYGSDDRYFVHTLIKDENKFVQRAYYKLIGQDDFLSVLEGPEVKQEQSFTMSYYFGPKEMSAMHVVDPRLDKTLDYSTFLAPLYRFFMWLLLFFFAYVKNYGLAIICLTIIIRLALLPFTIRSERSMKKHAELQKKLEYLQHRYKDDPQALSLEKAALIRKHGMPGLGSCLPMLLQLPIFYIIMRLLATSVELYKAPFLWIADISASDPWYILPILVTVTMLLQALVGDPKQRIQFLVIGLVFGAVAVNFSAGICIYLVVSTIFGVAQTAIQKQFKSA